MNFPNENRGDLKHFKDKVVVPLEKAMNYSSLDSLFQQTSSSSPSADTAGLFSHSKAEALLQRIVNVVEKHESKLQTMERSNEQMAEAMQQLNNKIAHVQVYMNSTIQRLDTIEKAINVKDNDLTVGECVAANRRTLVRTLSLVSAKVDAEELKEELKEQRENLDSTLDNFRRDLASNDALHKTNEAISSLVIRIDGMSDEVRNKVDKTLFKALSSENAALQNYAQFVKKTESTLATMEKTIEKFDNVHKTLSKRSDDIVNELKEFPSMSVIKGVENAMEELSQGMNDKVDAEALQKLCENTESIENRIKSIANDTNTLFASHETLAKHFTKRFDNMYTKAAIDNSMVGYLDKDAFHDAIEKISCEMETKVEGSRVDQLHQALSKLQSEITLTQKKVDLAVQFIALYDDEEE